MILETLIFILTTIICYYLYSYKKLHWYFKERGVKFLPGVPLFGNIIGSTFVKKHFLDELQDSYDAFPEEKYVGFFELTLPILLIRDPEIIKIIVVKDFDHFTDHREFLSAELDPLFGGSLVLMKGEKWRDMRTTLSPAFTATKMKCMFMFIQEITSNVLDYLNDHRHEDIDVDDLMRRYTNDVIASAGFGLEVNPLNDRDNDFYRIGSGVFNLSVRQQLLLMAATQFPKASKMLGMRLFSDKIYNFFSNIVSTTMEHRKKEKVERPDMIHLLMESNKEWTPLDLAAQVFIFFAAGFETTASTLVLTIHELALNSDIQDKLYQECKKFKEEKELTFDNMPELKYLDCVINGAYNLINPRPQKSKTLRKWCPAIIFDRTCTKTYTLPPPRVGGQPYVMKPGDVIYNLVNQIQLDPKYWPEPHNYDPERFSEKNKHNIKPFTFTPFGIGPRVCIGTRFAMMELKVLMFYLIVNFKIVKTAKTQKLIKLMPSSFSIRASGGTFVQFEKRQPDLHFMTQV